jgi:predicted metalloprotease
MDWDDLQRSENVEDERGSGSGFARGAIPLGLGGLVVVFVGSLLLGLNPFQVLSWLSGGGGGTSSYVETGPLPNDRTADFVRAVLGDTEDTWQKIFQQQRGTPYQEPKLGRVDELFDADPYSHEMNKRHKGLTQFLIPRGTAPKLLEAVEEPFHLLA